jgi:DNA-binding Lrp family transcriptional regulator
MAESAANSRYDEVDRRLIAALQCDGRLTAERAGAALGLSTRIVQRRWASLLADGGVRVVALPSQPPHDGVMLLHIKVLRGRIEAVAAALAARDDIPLVDLSAGGDQLSAVLLAGADGADEAGNRLVFRQLPATSAIASVDAQTVIHVFAQRHDWRLGALTSEERECLTTPCAEPPGSPRALDDLDRSVIAELSVNARTPASAIARATGQAESTIRRRLAALFDEGRLTTQVVVQPRRLGLTVDANLRLRVPPRYLDEAGRRLAAHPAVHGALATTGPDNLYIAVWLPDLDGLYRFITRDLAELEVEHSETMLVGRCVKGPGDRPSAARPPLDKSPAKR